MLCACAPVSRDHDQAPPVAPDENTAVVYVLRTKNRFASLVDAAILEDGRKIGALPVNAYLVHKTTRERHFYDTPYIPSRGVFLNMQKNGVAYLLGEFLPGTDGFALKEIPKKKAELLIRALRPVPALPALP